MIAAMPPTPECTQAKQQKTRQKKRTEKDNSLAHLLEQLVVLEAFVCWHLVLGLTLFLDDLLDLLLVLGRRVLLCLVLLRLSLALLLMAALVYALLLLLLHGLLSVVLVGAIIVLPLS